jgi:type II secretory pathway pseudopilin PulG
MEMSLEPRTQTEPQGGDEGFTLLAAIVMIFMVLLVLSIAAPRVAMQIKRDREEESAHRAEQYVRAIRIFYLKFKRYPSSVEELEKTNNFRSLRQKYVDPLTGKDNWKLIHFGENQTKVKGFFGEDLPGLQTGLGSAAGLASGTGSGTTTAPTSGFGGGSSSGFGGSSSSAFGSPGGSPGGSGAGGGFGAPGGSGPGSTTAGTGSTTGSTGIQSQDATTFKGGGGQIIGVGSSSSGEAMLVVNEQTSYETWEFLYDPRIEQLYAKSTLFGGIGSGIGSGNGNGFGNSNGNGSVPGFGTPIGGTSNPGNGTNGPTNPNPGGTVPQ